MGRLDERLRRLEAAGKTLRAYNSTSSGDAERTQAIVAGLEAIGCERAANESIAEWLCRSLNVTLPEFRAVLKAKSQGLPVDESPGSILMNVATIIAVGKGRLVWPPTAEGEKQCL